MLVIKALLENIKSYLNQNKKIIKAEKQMLRLGLVD